MAGLLLMVSVPVISGDNNNLFGPIVQTSDGLKITSRL
jgi:hypothetical protein